VRLLLDTHAFIWWLAGNPSLSSTARSAIGDSGNDILVSAASAWEITTKHRIGRLPEAAALAVDVEAAVVGQGFAALPVTIRHAQLAGSLTGVHRDPFDRMLIAQATLESATLVSNEASFDAHDVNRLW
jgi:PIN domain nuclease of toxin-antitoxin system